MPELVKQWPPKWRGRTWKGGCCSARWTLSVVELRRAYDALPRKGRFDASIIVLRALGLNQRYRRKAGMAIRLLNEAGLLKSHSGRAWSRVALG